MKRRWYFLAAMSALALTVTACAGGGPAPAASGDATGPSAADVEALGGEEAAAAMQDLYDEAIGRGPDDGHCVWRW